jgi:hypothetical protein
MVEVEVQEADAAVVAADVEKPAAVIKVESNADRSELPKFTLTGIESAPQAAPAPADVAKPAVTSTADLALAAAQPADTSAATTPVVAAPADTRSTVKVFRRGPIVIDRVVFTKSDGTPAPVIQTFDALRIDVHYRCDGQLPQETLGIGIGIERERDMTLVAQFNTVNPAGNEMVAYDEAPFRKLPGRKGIVSAVLPNLQLLEGGYLISLGLCPNVPGVSEFYEYHHRVYQLQVIPAGYASGAVYYPVVDWQHRVDTGAG